MKWNKIVLLAAGIALGAGLLLMAAGFALGGASTAIYFNENGFNVEKVGDEKEMKTIELEEFENIDISILAGRIEIIPSDKNLLEYSLHSGEEVEQCEVRDGTLVFRTGQHFSISGFSIRDSYVRLYFKADSAFGAVSLQSMSGGIDADGIAAKEFFAKSTSGSKNIRNITADKITVDGLSGSTKASGLRAGEMTIKSVSGNVALDGLTCDKLSVRNTSGGIKLSALETGGLNVSGVSGGASVQGKLRGKTELRNSSGSIKVYNALDKSECGYALSSTSGSCKVDNESFSGSVGTDKENFIDASSTSGGVRLYFSSQGE